MKWLRYSEWAFTITMDRHCSQIVVKRSIDHCVSGFDIRIAPTVDMEEFEKKIKGWCTDAGEDVTYEFVQVCMKFGF